MSKPSEERLLSKSLSSGVENISGAGVLSKVEKSCAGSLSFDFSKLLEGDICSESVDETERRFVLAGVRVGY